MYLLRKEKKRLCSDLSMTMVEPIDNKKGEIGKSIDVGNKSHEAEQDEYDKFEIGDVFSNKVKTSEIDKSRNWRTFNLG